MRALTYVLGLVCLAGCGGPPTVCAAGATQACSCAVGQGTQTCAADGSAWGTCEGCGGAPLCTAGATQACDCAVGKGTQTCAANGSAWGTCEQCTVGAAQACDAHAQATCAKLQECMAWGMVATYGDEATCRTRERIGCEDLFAAAGTTAKPSDFLACADAYPQLSCSDFLLGTEPEACDFPKGTLPNGGACGSGLQCQSGECRFTASATCGTCSALATAGAGASCADDGVQCEEGLLCAQNDVCVLPGGADASCSDNFPCKAPLGCVQGHCVSPVAAGASCGSDQAVCDSLAGLFCISGTCQAIAFEEPGRPCGLETGITLCRASGLCNFTDGASGTCMAAAADGAACDTTSGPTCMPPAKCSGGVCQLQGLSCD